MSKLTGYLLLLVALVVPSCVTPENWSPESHRAAMRQCTLMCGKGRVRAYDPWSGECTCAGDLPRGGLR